MFAQMADCRWVDLAYLALLVVLTAWHRIPTGQSAATLEKLLKQLSPPDSPTGPTGEKLGDPPPPM